MAPAEEPLSAVLVFEGVHKRFGDVEALAGVDLTLEGRGVFGILGPNGAGKTTLLDLALGFGEPDRGTVRLFGEPLTPYPRARVGAVLQREFVMEGITVGEYAELFGAIYGVAYASILRKAALEPRSKTELSRLSGGEAARLFVAAATAHGPELVLLDEPTAALDPQNKERMGDELRALGERALVVVTTHDLEEATRICDRVAFMAFGQVRATGEPKALVERWGTLRDAFFGLVGKTLTRGGEIE